MHTLETLNFNDNTEIHFTIYNNGEVQSSYFLGHKSYTEWIQDLI